MLALLGETAVSTCVPTSKVTQVVLRGDVFVTFEGIHNRRLTNPSGNLFPVNHRRLSQLLQAARHQPLATNPGLHFPDANEIKNR